MTKLTGIDAYPLYWPDGWKRTPSHKRTRSRYELQFARARDEVLASLRRMGARDVVLSTNVPLRRDGLPLAGQREPDDPGVAVYWTSFNLKEAPRPHVMACDARVTVRENLRAIGLALEGIRAIERAGASQILERAYAGFAALPANAGTEGMPHWRDVFGVPPSAMLSRAQIEAMYRGLAKHAHPDRGGGVERMIELNRAREEALAEALV